MDTDGLDTRPFKRAPGGFCVIDEKVCDRNAVVREHPSALKAHADRAENLAEISESTWLVRKNDLNIAQQGIHASTTVALMLTDVVSELAM